MNQLRHLALVCLGFFAAVAQAEERGTIYSEYWLGIPGNNLTGLTSDARYPASPSGVSFLTSFQTPVNTADTYGTCVRGYLYPPVTGAYQFWVAGDDQCELWLSTDDSSAAKVLIANTYSWTSPQEWTKYASQQSAQITLQAGSRYYIEALHKEGYGGDSLAVAWAYPGVARQVIPGEFLAPAVPAPVPGSGTGSILREWWSGLTGTAVSDLTLATAFPASPSGRDYLTTFETPANWGDNYGTRVRGFLRPTQSGTYFFWISGDDACQLWLSQDAQPSQKGLIASVPGYTAAREWTKYPQQKSIAIDLQAGASYYIEALHKEGGGGDIVSVAWSGPGIGDTPTVITGDYLSPSSTTNPPTPVGQGSGTILVETWDGIPGTNIAALTSSSNFPARPSARGVLTQFKSPVDAADSYGRRIRGYVCPTITGNYRFWLASDDEGSLRLSTDENPANAVVIASVATWTGVEEWDKFPTQQSALIPLTGGQRYYIEAMQKEGTGGDHVAVAWIGPSLIKGVIPGAYLAPVIAPVIEGIAEFTTSTTVTLSATATGGSLRYTTDGTTPTAASALYSAPFTVSTSTLVKAVHIDVSGHVSEVAEKAFVRTGAGTGLFGAYYAHNQVFSGTPITRVDPTINFSGSDSFIIPDIGPSFSARWTGMLETRFNEPYTLRVSADDGVVVSLNGVVVISNPAWTGTAANAYTIASAQAGQRYVLQIDYNQKDGPGQIKLEWQSVSEGLRVVPTSSLYPIDMVSPTPATSLTVRAPTHTYISPVCIEGTYATTLPSVTTSEYTAPAHVLGKNIWYANMPLLTGTVNNIAVQENATTVHGQTTWDIITIDAPQVASLSVRVADSIALESGSGSAISIVHPDGAVSSLPASPVTRYVTFDSPGLWTIGSANTSSSLSVTVFDGRFQTDETHPLAVEMGSQYDMDMSLYSLIQPNASELAFVSQDTGLTVSSQASHVYVKGSAIGVRYASIRIGSPAGPILSPLNVTCFQITGFGNIRTVLPDGSEVPPYSNSGLPELFFASNEEGESRRRITITMTPLVPNVKLTIEKFAHPNTFLGGANSFTITTDGANSSLGEPGFVASTLGSGVTIGKFSFDLLQPGQTITSYCLKHNATVSVYFLSRELSYPIPVSTIAKQ